MIKAEGGRMKAEGGRLKAEKQKKVGIRLHPSSFILDS
jgi:hypothetical protein